MKKMIFLIPALLCNFIFGCTWQVPYTDIPDPLDTVTLTFPQMCASDSGYRMSIWQRDESPAQDNSVNKLYFSLFDPNTNMWSAVAPIDPAAPANANQFDAHMCCYPNGNAAVVWIEKAPISSIKVSVYTVGVGWSLPTILDGSNRNGDPDITCFSSGEAVVVWSKPSNAVTNPFSTAFPIQYSYFDGTTWSPAAPIPGVPNLLTGIPHICSDGQGRAIAAWVWNNTAFPNQPLLQTSVFTPPNNWTPVATITPSYPFVVPYYLNNNANASPNVDIDIACDPNGNAIVAWRDRLQMGNIVASYGDGITWSSPVIISNPSSTGLVSQVSSPPSEINACMGEDGSGHIAFRTDTVTAPPTQQVEVADFDPLTGTFNTATILDQTTDPDFVFSNPQVCCGPCGSSTVIWADPNSEIKVVSYDTDVEAWTLPPQVLDTSTLFVFPLNYNQGLRPNITCDANGIVYPLWQYNDGGVLGITTTSGSCINPIVAQSLKVEGKLNRFPFQTECFCVVSWEFTLCPINLSRIDVYKNGAFFKSYPGTTTAIRISSVDCTGTYTVVPVNFLGLPLPGTTFVVN